MLDMKYGKFITLSCLLLLVAYHYAFSKPQVENPVKHESLRYEPVGFLKTFNLSPLHCEKIPNNVDTQLRIGYYHELKQVGFVYQFDLGTKNVAVVYKISKGKVVKSGKNSIGKQARKKIEALLNPELFSPVKFEEAMDQTSMMDGVWWVVEYRNMNNAIISQVLCEGINEQRDKVLRNLKQQLSRVMDKKSDDMVLD